MPEEPVAVVRRIFDSWSQGDFAASQPLLARDVVVSWGEPPAADVVCHGPAEVAERFSAFLAQWDGFRAEAEEYIPIGGVGVLVVARQYGVGRQSGVETEALVHIAWVIRGDEVVGVHWFFDRTKALETAGLSE